MAQLSEQQIFNAFGLGAQAQEPAAPATEGAPAAPGATEGGEGAQVQEPAAPATETAHPEDGAHSEPTAGTAEPEDPATNAEGGTAQGSEPLTTEQRRQNAARRRQEEQQRHQQAIDSAVQRALADQRQQQEAAMADFFAKAGLKNTVTGEPITNMQQFNDWQSAFSAARLERNLKSGKLTKEDLDEVISQHPAVQQAQQVIERNRETEKQARQAQARARVDADIAQVGQLAESHNLGFKIESAQDLLNMPNAKEFYNYIRQRKSIPEAFKLTFFDQMVEGKARAAQQTAMVNSRGKDHLNGTGAARGAGAASVPQSEMAMYRLFNPGATEAQIQAHFNKDKKKFG